jgi:uncharacterized LabA/DUF88 family protein
MNRQLVRSYYYTAPFRCGRERAGEKRNQARFFKYLDSVPYLETRFGRLASRTTKCPDCKAERATKVQKGVDLRLGVDLLAHATRRMYDVAVLVSGDGDFVDAVNAAKELGKHVELVTFAAGRSMALARAADLVVELSAQYFQSPSSLFRPPLVVRQPAHR